MFEKFRRRESAIFPLQIERIGYALMEMREVAEQTGGYNMWDYNRHMELNNPDLYDFIQGRKQGYRENEKEIEGYEYEAYMLGVAVAFKAIHDSISQLGIQAPKVTWKDIRKYEKRRIKTWNKLYKKCGGKTEFVTSIFNSLLEEDPSFEAYRYMLSEPKVDETTDFAIFQDGGWVLPPDPASNPLVVKNNQRRYYTCVGISDVYFPLRMADAHANRRKNS